MWNFFSKKSSKDKKDTSEQPKENNSTPDANNNDSTTNKQGFFKRLTQGLKRTKDSFSDKLANLVLGKKTIDKETLTTIETYLLVADVGIETTNTIIENLTKKVSRQDIKNPEKLIEALKEELNNIVTKVEKPLCIPNLDGPFVILVAGVNGAGKTTTIGKITKKLQQEGKKVMLAAGDTFRAAAIEQLKTWGERNDVPVISQEIGSDSASVIFDAFQAAKARGFDVLIADTAGRLHTQSNLMNELSKVVKVIKKIDPNAPHESMIVLDATIGQNALTQAKKFNEAIKLSGITITKLDGTAKGGILFAIAKQMGLPIRYIGIGEKIDDLREFSANDFVDALFTTDEKSEHD